MCVVRGAILRNSMAAPKQQARKGGKLKKAQPSPGSKQGGQRQQRKPAILLGSAAANALSRTLMANAAVPRPKVRAMAPIVSSYHKALMDPFSLQAKDARVPDMYPEPTAVLRHKVTFGIKTNADGDANVLLLPSAYMHAIAFTPSVARGASPAVGGLVVGNSHEHFATTSPAGLAKYLSSYRVVGWGARVRMTQAVLNVTGRYAVAAVPCRGYVPDWVSSGYVGGTSPPTDVSSSATAAHPISNADLLKQLGLPRGDSGGTVLAHVSATSSTTVASEYETPLDGTALKKLPVHRLFVANEINGAVLELRGKPVSPAAFLFRSSENSDIGYDVSEHSGTHTNVGSASHLSIDGWTGFALSINNATANTEVCEVELVYHLEGNVPSVGTTDIVGATTASAQVSMSNFHNALDQCARAPWVSVVDSRRG